MLSMAGHVHTMMTETTMKEASKSMQDISKTASDMETEEKKRERASKQNTYMVTSDTALPEQKKTHNEPIATKQALVNALFQVITKQVSLEQTLNRKVSNTISNPTTKKVSIEADMA